MSKHIHKWVLAQYYEPSYEKTLLGYRMIALPGAKMLEPALSLWVCMCGKTKTVEHKQ